MIPYGGNVVVRNVTCDGGHGISIGSIQHGYVSNVTVENVRFSGSDNGARIKTYPNHTGLVTGIIYRDIAMREVVNPILIDGAYCPMSQRAYPCPPGDAAVKIENIVFENITGSGAVGRVGRFGCSAVSLAQGDTVILCCHWLAFVRFLRGSQGSLVLSLLSFSVKMMVSSMARCRPARTSRCAAST